MINCLSFSPLSFHSVSQLSRFKFPLFLNSTSTNNNLLFELPSPLISSWPPFRILLLMPMPCFVNYFISLLFPLHPSAFCLLRHLRFDCRHLYLHLSPRLSLPLNSPQVQSTSWMPHQQYVMQPTVCCEQASSLFILFHVIVPQRTHFFNFLVPFTTSFLYSTHLPIIGVQACLSIYSLCTSQSANPKAVILFAVRPET